MPHRGQQGADPDRVPLRCSKLRALGQVRHDAAEVAAILRALDDIVRTIDIDRLHYTGEHEDFFFYDVSNAASPTG